MKHDWSTLKKLIWLKRAVLSAVSAILKTVTGLAPLLLGNALAHPIHSLTQYGKCTQSGTPTPDAPQDIVCNNGVLKLSPNLCNPALYTGMGYFVSNNKVVNSDSNGTLVFPCKPNTTYSWWHTAGTGGVRAFELPTDTVTIGQEATWAVQTPVSSQKDTVKKYTTSADAKLLCVLFGRVNDAQVDRTMDEQLADFMLVEGGVSVATEYKPYGVVYAGGYSIGKNLANVNAQTALVGYYITTQGVVTADLYNWMYQPYIRVKKNTTYTLSTSSAVYFVSISEYSKADDSGFIVRKVGSTGGNTSLTITTGETTNYIRFGTNIDRTAVTLDKVLAINWQFEEGETATAYEPYTEIPYQPEVLTVSGKNLYDKSAAQNGDISSTTGAPITRSNRILSDFFPVNAGNSYTAAGTIVSDGEGYSISRLIYALYDSDKGFIEGSRVLSPIGSTSFSVPADSAARYARVCFFDPAVSGLASVEDSVFQIERGTTATDYEPYVTPQTASVPMLLSVGDYKDEVELISGPLTHRVGVYVVKGADDEAWTKAVQSGTTNFMFYMNMLGPAREGNANTLCTVAKGAANNWTSSPDRIVVRSNRNFGFLNPTGSTKDSTVEEFQAKARADYLAGKPWIIVYAARTETTDQTTAQHLHTNEGTNVVDVTSNVDPVELKAEYYATE